MKRPVWFVCIFLAAIGTVSLAHHSITGAYDTSREITLEGVVSQFQFINPHPFLTMDVKQSNGTAQAWRMEMDNRSELVEIGMTGQTFKRGDRVIVKGSPGRNQSQTLYINRLDRPGDGFRYEQIGTTPRISNTH